MNSFYGRNSINPIPYTHYNKQLKHYLYDYMGIIDEQEYFNKRFHPNAKEKAQRILRYKFDPDNSEFQKECKAIEDEIGKTTREIFRKYNTIIMQIIGKIAECVIVDNCNNDTECNRKLINLAMLKQDINTFDNDIQYKDYMAFSTSYKYTFKFDEDNFFSAYRVKYSPCETTMDIAWCLQNDPLVYLMYAFYENKKTIKADYAHLQIKATTNCYIEKLDQYPLTPIIVFDLDNNINVLKSKYPLFTIISARSIKYEMQNELEHYYKILLAYAAGIINKIDIDENEFYTNDILKYLNGMSMEEILNESLLGVNRSNFIKLINKQSKKIRIREVSLPLKLVP